MNGVIADRLIARNATRPQATRYAETSRHRIRINRHKRYFGFSKIEAAIRHRSIDGPARQHEDVGSMMAFQAAAKKLELIVDVHPDVPQHVKGDSQRIRQCLINLVGNAIKFTREGEVAISVSVASTVKDRMRVRFAVSDTGIGISADTLNGLFKPFTQADAQPSSLRRH